MPKTQAVLKDIMKNQFLVAEKTLETIKEQSQALVEDNLSKLMKQNEILEVLSKEMEELEGKRIEALKAFKKAFNIENGLSLQDLIKEEGLSQDFKEVAKKLLKVLEELQELNELNEMLIKQSIYYNQRMQSVLNQGSTYQPDGKKGQRQISSLLDHSV